MGDYHPGSLAAFTEGIATNISRVLAARPDYSHANAHVPRTPGMSVALTVAAVVSILFTILGNQSVLLAFWVSRRIRKLPNYFLASLAVSDLFVGVFSMPLFLQYLYLDTWALGRWVCDVWLTLDWTVCLTSQFTVFLITTDRFLFLRIPGKYGEWRTERKVFAGIAVTWVLPLAIFSVSIIGWPFFVAEGRTIEDAVCYVQFMDDSVFTLIWTFAYYWIPLVVMCVQYGLIYNIVLKLRKPTAAVPRARQFSVSTRGAPTFSNTTSLDLRTQLFRNSVRWGNNRLVPSRSRPAATGNDVNGERAQSSSMHTTYSDAFVLEMREDGKRRPHPPVTSRRDSLLTPTLETVEAKTAVDQVDSQTLTMEESSSVGKTTSECRAGCAAVESFGLKSDDAAPSVDSRTNKCELKCDSPTSSVDSITNKRELKCDSPTSSVDSITNRRELKCDSPIPVDSRTNKRELKCDSPTSSVDSITNRRELKCDSPVSSVDSITNKRQLKSDSPPSHVDSRTNKHDLKCNNPAPVDSRTNKRDLKCHNSAPVDSRTNKIELKCHNSAPVDSRTNKLELKCHNSASLLDSRTNKGDTRVSVGRRLRNTAARWSLNCAKCVRVHRRGQGTSRAKLAQKALRRITLVVGAFVLCWTPYHVMAIVIAIRGYDVINDNLYIFTYWLRYLNSTINPFCYALLNEEFKRTLIRIFKLDWHRS
ncbi:muscarinic acetylcholine receptor M2-like [Gigantopelta aegis]|uniref:muscarinic acetylcholine receptor M2-like n=1 Tax=Gigantopelta aegis TaxID=1735272 RepID=UPI001B887CB0|nr:muscarinic acetylcholine receptor M2-like [Gigantopelta aegis]